MNKQEVIEKIEKEKSNLNAWEDLTRNRALDDALAIVRKLDEPEKPVIPLYVADWLEVCKDNLALSLANSMNNIVMRTNNQPDKTIHWIAKNSETFAKAWLFGYEIKKDKLYTVFQVATEEYLYTNGVGKLSSVHVSYAFVEEHEEYHFTQQKLEELNYWENPAFEIKEVKK